MNFALAAFVARTTQVPDCLVPALIVAVVPDGGFELNTIFSAANFVRKSATSETVAPVKLAKITYSEFFRSCNG